MMNPRCSIASLALVCLCGAAAGMAEQRPVMVQPANTVTSQRDRLQARSATNLIPVERLLKADVVGTDNKKIGDVDDLIISRRTGRIIYALVGEGGVLGIGEHLVAVPFPAFTWNERDRNLSLPMTKDRLKAAPAVQGDDWKTLGESARADQIRGYFNVPADFAEPMDADVTATHSTLQAGEWPLLHVSDIRGKKLMSDDGRELGEVDDLIVDASTGRIALAAVTFGGTLGFGADRVAIPWPAFDVNKDGGLFAPNLDKAKITSAPHLTERDWGELNDPKFGSSVYSHYGIEAPWLNQPSGMSSAPGTTGNMDDAGVKQYEQAYASGAEGTATGKVTSINQTSPTKGVPEVTTLTVKTDQGENVIVQVAPRWYLDQSGAAFKTGDTVNIKGRWANFDGRKCLIGTEVTGANGKPLTLHQSNGKPSWTWR